jgi:AAA family ATP:ADP antiporter
MEEEKKEFGIWRSLLWPVHRSEVKKVVSMLILLFLLCISYNVLRNLKDTIVLTAKNSGADVIPFLKVWGILPGAIITTWIYTRLCRFFSKEAVFYVVIAGFLSYFLFFTFVLHPHSEALHLDTLGDFLTEHMPAGFRGLIAMIRNWTFSTFYIISEMWAVVVLAILYWGFANDVTEVSQAKRTYGILNIGSNVAPVLGGSIGILCASVFRSSTTNVWEHTLSNTTITLICLGTVSMILFYWINRKVVTRRETPSTAQDSKEKIRLSIRESIRYISKSKYLLCIALIVLGYNISINITDVLWKKQLSSFFTDSNEMLIHMNLITMGTGVVATVCGCLFSLMVNRLGWTFVAILTPLIMTVLAVGFFIFLFCGDVLSGVTAALFGTTPVALTVYFGSLQNCLSKAGKYSVFDASKELAFLPLDPDAKLRGKAAIDGLGSGVGKSGASLTYQGLMLLFGGLSATTPYVSAILVVVFIAWITGVVKLGGLFKKAVQTSSSTA